MVQARRSSTRALCVAAATVALAALAPAPASAAQVTINEDTLDTTFVAAPGEANRLEVRFTTIDEDSDTGTPEIPVIEYHDFQAPVTAPTSDFCQAEGQHTVYCFHVDEQDALATIQLGDGDDILREGTPGRDAAFGGPGKDLLVGRGGNDRLDGGEGDDTLEDPEWSGCSGEGGSLGADTLVGGPGTDELMQICRSKFVTVTLDGQANDGSEGEGDNVGGDIEVIEGPGYETGMKFVGDDQPNVVHGGGLPSVLIGGGGNDQLYGGVDNDQIDGGPGDDIVEGWGGSDTIDGGVGADNISGEGGSTITDGTGGADVITARDGTLDTVACGSGADQAIVDGVDVIANSGRDVCESVDRGADDGGGGPGGGGPGGPGGPGGGVASAVGLGAKSAKVSKGSFLLPLECAASATCAGGVSVKTASPVAAGRKKRRPIGSARFSIAAGKSKRVRVKLNRTGRKLMRRGKTLKVVVTLKLDGQRPKTARLKLKR